MDINEHEWPRAATVSACFFIISLGLELGRIGRDCYFLSHAGAEKIPFMYMVIAALMVVISPLYSYLIDEVNHDSLLRWLAGSGAGITLAAWLLIRSGIAVDSMLPYIVFCVIEVFALFLLMHAWSVIEGVFDAGEGKRFFPLIGAVGLVGKIVGGFVTNIFAAAFGAVTLFLLWCALLLAVLPLSRLVEQERLRHLGEVQSAAAAPGQTTKVDKVDSTGDSSLSRVSLIYTLTFMAIPMWIIIYIIEYNYFHAMSRVFPHPDRLATFFGLFNSAAAILGLLLQLFVTSRLLKSKGVGNASLVYPFTLTLGAIFLLIFSLFPGAQAPRLDFAGIAMLVVLARLCDISFYYSIYDSSSQLLFYSLPDSLRNKGRAFLSGIVLPLGSGAAGGIIVLLSSVLGQPVYSVAFVSVCLGFLLIALALNITPEYLSSLLRNFQFSRPGRLREILDEIGRLEVSDARYTLMHSVVKQDVKEASFAVEKLFEIRDDELLFDLEEALADMHPDTIIVIIRRLQDEKTMEAEAFIRAACKYCPGIKR